MKVEVEVSLYCKEHNLLLNATQNTYGGVDVETCSWCLKIARKKARDQIRKTSQGVVKDVQDKDDTGTS